MGKGKRKRAQRPAEAASTEDAEQAAPGPTNGAKKAKVPKATAAARGLSLSDGLPWLLGEGSAGGCSVPDFRKQYFERTAFHLQRASNSGYYKALKDLSTPESLFALMDNGTIPVYRVNMFRCRDGSTKETPSTPPASAADVRRLFSEGWSIQWLQPQQEHDELARLVSVLESQFGSLVGVNAYLTPPGAQGLAPHYDDVEVFVLQLGGRKSWKLHRSTSASPLPPEAQSLPRYSSGDLPAESLSPCFMEPVLGPGDMLYFPRGTIHHAPNQNAEQPSVHLTISTYQRQTLYDLASKTFEETMSELWDTDVALRHGLPWGALSPEHRSYPDLCASIAGIFRRLADATELEAKMASSAQEDSDAGSRGSVAGALAEMGAEFVSNRMPPLPTLGKEVRAPHTVTQVTPTCNVILPDPSAIALLPVPVEEDGGSKLVHCIANSRRDHMMRHPGSDGPCTVEGGGGDEDGEEAEEEEPEEDAEEEDADGGESSDGEDVVGAHEAAVLRQLCRRAPCPQLASGGRQAPGSDGNLAAVLLKAGVKDGEWKNVCSFLTGLAGLGLVEVASGSELQSQMGLSMLGECKAAIDSVAKKGKRRR